MNEQNSSRPKAYQSESNQRIYNFLKSSQVGVLATADHEGIPHAAVIYFSIDENFMITFTTKQETKKHSNLQENKNVMLVAYEASSQTTAQVAGVVEDITDTDAAQAAYGMTLRAARETSESGVPPMSKLDAGKYVAYRLVPASIKMAIFVRPDPGGYDIYETVELGT